jgi:hypothetical protein
MPSVERRRWLFTSEASGTRARYLLEVEEGLSCTCCIALECSALDAEASGPLHQVTVAASEHRMPTAIVRPGCFLMAPTLPPKYVENARLR